ncbi:MAG TPA: polyprenol monophosphomannose synthase [Acidimicrobiales bacterium]|nr:polyprenol monophosphomannose synthase [Acidimicrobiales bacterium]
MDLSSAASTVNIVPAAVAIVPTYNEVANLADIWARLRAAAPDVGLLIVDDNSPDGTGELADRLAKRDPLTWVIHRPVKNGLGPAYAQGMQWALDHGARYIIEMDADGSHPPNALRAMLEAAIAGADLVIGSRYIAGGATVGWSAWRLALSRAGNAYVRAALGLEVHDSTSGFRVYRASALRRIDLGGVTSQGYCFQVEMTLATALAGLSIREIPISFTERERGKSKMSWAVTIEALLRVTHWSVVGRRCPKGPAFSAVRSGRGQPETTTAPL